MDLQIGGEVQLGKGILRRRMPLPGGLLEPIPGICPIGNQQRTVPPELAQQVLGVAVAALGQLFQL